MKNTTKALLLLTACLLFSSCDDTSGSSPTTTTTSAKAPAATVPSTGDSGSTPADPVVSTPDVSVVTPTPTPAPSPTPDPTPAPTPTPVAYDPSVSHNAGSVQTSYRGQYSCDLLSNGKISCTDGSTTVVTSDANYVKVLVGDSVACAIQRQNPPYGFTQPNVNCTALSNAGCSAAPPTYYGVYCWDGNSGSPVAMDTQLQIAPQVTGVSSYVTGPSSLSLSGGQVCISQDVFNLLSSPYGTRTQRITVCGNQARASDGFLIP